MKQAKYVCAGSAILFLLLGVYFQLGHMRSSSLVAGKYGGSGTRSIDAPGLYILSGIMFGILLMFFGIEKSEKKEKSRKQASRKANTKRKNRGL